MATQSHPGFSDLVRNGASPAEAKPSSMFWTREDGQLSLQSFCPGADLSLQPHTYSEYTIVTCLEGEICKSQLGQSQVIGRGETLMGNHGVEHTSGYRSYNGIGCEAVVLSVDRRVLGSLAREFNLPSVDGANSPLFMGKAANVAVHECARVIADELRSGLPGHKIIIETMATRMLVEAIRAWPRANIEKIPADLSPRLPRRDFVRAHEFMRWCRKDHFSLQHLCQFLGSSEERLNRLFLASTGHTPASFYNRMLLEQARNLLHESQFSVKEIGFRLGFKTCSHFIAAFRREFDTTPQEFRKSVNSMNVTLRFG